jgi:iron-sulfur cluster repair protein YtfE (RIC family)
MRVISMRLKYEEFRRAKVSFCCAGIVVLQEMAFRDHMTLLSECVTNVAF